jgi:peptidoglycan/xylan/chitin deacetylase (PgdA/CDA1 family)
MVRQALKKALGSGRLLSAVCRPVNRRVAVLGYHDLREKGEFASWMRVKADEFEKQIVELKKHCVFLKPSELFGGENTVKGKLNLLLTFDDGFLSCLTLALPILKRHSIPALFFVSTSHVQSGEPFWFEDIVATIQTFGLSSLDLREFGIGQYTFRLGNGSARWEGIERLLGDIKGLSISEGTVSKAIVTYLGKKLGKGATSFADGHRPLNRYEIQEMHKTGICFFGSHSHNHEILTKLGNEDVERNLLESKSVLEEIIGEPVVQLSYPNGDVDQRVKGIVKTAGFKFGYGTKPGLVNRSSDGLDIPRILIGGYDSVEDIFFKLLTQVVKKRR